ncbi:MAG: glycosyl hydrolase family 28-related protein [Sandaracinaceae bacterium]
MNARLTLLLLLLCGCASPDPVGVSRASLTSALYGSDGEAFVPEGRLMDWSYAGYGAGERAIPDVAVVANVMDYGAVGDGSTDDGQALEDAISAAEAAGGGAVLLPAGRYSMRRRLELSSGVVLRGAGPLQTVLYFPEALTPLYGGDYSFGGGFIQAYGNSTLPTLTTVTEGALRGSTSLVVADASGIAVGDWILIRQTDAGGTLMRRLHDDHVPGGTDNTGDVGMNFPTRVTAIDGDTLTLERALIVDVETRWSPTVYAVVPTLEEVGVEHLTMEFPVTTYPGHFNEEGFNGIHYRHAWNSWVRDVRIRNADYGVSFNHSFFTTATGVVLDTTGDRGELTGHHGLNNGFGGDNLFVDFDIQTTFVHDLTNEWYAHGIVFARGRGDDLCMDHHRAAPYATLWTELDLGAGERPFRSGGRGDRGPHTASYDTLWNVRGARALSLPAANYGPTMTFVGFDTRDSIPEGALDWHLEHAESTDPPATDVEPANLWVAMRERRLGPPPTPDAGVPDAGMDAGASIDAGGQDAGPPMPAGDAASRPDSSVSVDAGTEPMEEGCSCRAAGGDRRGAPWALLPLAALYGWRRRRHPGRG